MIGTVIFEAICSLGIMFLGYVLIAFWREERVHHRKRRLRARRPPVVVQLPPDPIFTAAFIRPAGVPEDAPDTIVPNLNRTAAEFYIGESEREPATAKNWRLFVNPQKPHIRKAR